MSSLKRSTMPVQNSQFLKGEQVPSVSAKKKNLAIKNYAICTETSYLRFSERRHANFKCLETYFPPILAWVRFAWQKSLIKLFTLAFCVILGVLTEASYPSQQLGDHASTFDIACISFQDNYLPIRQQRYIVQPRVNAIIISLSITHYHLSMPLCHKGCQQQDLRHLGLM